MNNSDPILVIYEAIEYIEKYYPDKKVLEFERDLLEHNEPKITVECLCDEIEDREIKLPTFILRKLLIIAKYYELQQRYLSVLEFSKLISE